PAATLRDAFELVSGSALADRVRQLSERRLDLSDINRRGVMKSVAGATVALGLSEQGRRQGAKNLPAYRTAGLPVAQRVADLLSRMTLEEKLAQTLCPWQIDRALRDDQGNFAEEKAREILKN